MQINVASEPMIVQVLMGELPKRGFVPCQSRGLRRARIGARGRTFTYPAAKLPARTHPRRCSLALTRTHPHGHLNKQTHVCTHTHTPTQSHTRGRARTHTPPHVPHAHRYSQSCTRRLTVTHAHTQPRTYTHARAHGRTHAHAVCRASSIMEQRRSSSRCPWSATPPARRGHESKMQPLHNRVSLPGVSPFSPTWACV